MRSCAAVCAGVVSTLVWAAVATGAAGDAGADSADRSVPNSSDIVTVSGADVQPMMLALTGDYDRSNPTHGWYSFTAGSGTTPKTGCSPLTYPDPVTELRRNAHPSGNAGSYCVDSATTTRAASPAGGTLAYLTFAKDAVTWSATSTTSAPTHAPGSLTTIQLRAIYTCDAGLLGTGRTGPVTWNEVGGTSTNAVVPVVPQSSSGTRAFFLAMIGVTTLGACVLGQDNSVAENEGTNAIFQSASAPNLVFPYAISTYLAQSEHGHGSGTQGNQILRSVNAVAPTTGTAPNLTINPAFPYTRAVYGVVRNTGAAHVPTYLQPIYGNGNTMGKATGYLCTNAVARTDIGNYGYLPAPSSTCGKPLVE